ncbi:MAG: DUF4956 domain-containing protein [Clostridia bacterium]|nr:DUF4956 domain-containing protein [Clostridia bacterium]
MNICQSIITEPLTGAELILCLVFSLVCGAAVAALMRLRFRASSGFSISLLIIPSAVCLLLIMVKGSLGTGIAIAGVFSLVRFRSVPGRGADIAAVLLDMTAGLACASGYVLLGLLFTAAAVLIAFSLSYVSISAGTENRLKISVPESLDFSGVFDDVLNKYTRKYRLSNIKTANMGSLYRLEYIITLKDQSKSREFIDELRCLNGNLEIQLGTQPEGESEL